MTFICILVRDDQKFIADKGGQVHSMHVPKHRNVKGSAEFGKKEIQPV